MIVPRNLAALQFMIAGVIVTAVVKNNPEVARSIGKIFIRVGQRIRTAR